MRAGKIASVAALVGGVAWLVKVGLIWGNGGTNTDGGLVAVCYILGLLALGVALLAGGYSVVATAPVWLRVVVSLAVLALGWIIFGSIDSAAKGLYSGDDWLRDELGILVSAALALVGGAVGLLRSRSHAPEPKVTRGRRALR
jgi:hypothetical protein